MAKLHCYEKPEDEYPHTGKSHEFDEYDLTGIPASVSEVWYWYATAPYEGSGNAILKYEDGTWAALDLGHCSCYGPMEHCPKVGGFPTLDALRASISPDAMRGYSTIFAALTDQGEA